MTALDTPPRVAEKALVFPCEGESLLGVLSCPDPSMASATTGVVVIVGGPQYRAGSHRQFVLLARTLAAAGFPVLRFDYRGMGDSTGALRDFNDVQADIGAAVAALQQQAPQVRRVVLWGLCDGASAALLYWQATRDARLAGLCLLNPWVRSTESLARTHVKHYYAQRLKERAFWIKLFSGKVALGAVAGLVRNIRLAFAGSGGASTAAAQKSYQERMALAWHGFGGRMLLLLSGDDYTAKEFVEYVGANAAWADAWKHAQLERHELAGADHTFSDAASRALVENLTLAWLQAAPTE